jgi:excisionase family DNA binding protein
MSEDGVRIWIRKGLLPSVRIRQTVRVPRTAIDELLTNSTKQQ